MLISQTDLRPIECVNGPNESESMFTATTVSGPRGAMDCNDPSIVERRLPDEAENALHRVPSLLRRYR